MTAFELLLAVLAIVAFWSIVGAVLDQLRSREGRRIFYARDNDVVQTGGRVVATCPHEGYASADNCDDAASAIARVLNRSGIELPE